jgi:hypothetical protein
MDGKKIPYRTKFEKLATRKGEIVAVFSGDAFQPPTYPEGIAAESEKEIWESYQTSLAHNEAMPDDLKVASAHHMEVSQEARAAIQAYKIRHSMPLNTPPVEDTPPLRYSNAANDENYGADILPFPSV